MRVNEITNILKAHFVFGQFLPELRSYMYRTRWKTDGFQLKGLESFITEH